jgi:hypothetical protein
VAGIGFNSTCWSAEPMLSSSFSVLTICGTIFVNKVIKMGPEELMRSKRTNGFSSKLLPSKEYMLWIRISFDYGTRSTLNAKFTNQYPIYTSLV